MSRRARWALALTLVIGGLLAAGPSDPAIAASLGARLGGADARYHATERLGAAGPVLNEERGHLNGLQAALRTCGFGNGGWCVQAQARSFDNPITYDGRTQIGLPLQTQTDLRLLEADLLLQHHLQPAGSDVQVRLGLGWLHRRLARDIRPTVSTARLTETLMAEHLALELALEKGLPAPDGGIALGAPSLQAELRLEHPWRQRLRVSTDGRFDPFELVPVARTQVRLGFALEVDLVRRWRWRVELWRQRLDLGASDATLVRRDGRPASIASYPGSRQWLGGISGSLVWASEP